MLEASVVICAYTLDRWSDLNAAVDSVRRQTHPARELIVVIITMTRYPIAVMMLFHGCERWCIRGIFQLMGGG